MIQAPTKRLRIKTRLEVKAASLEGDTQPWDIFGMEAWLFDVSVFYKQNDKVSFVIDNKQMSIMY